MLQGNWIQLSSVNTKRLWMCCVSSAERGIIDHQLPNIGQHALQLLTCLNPD
jgi:hypothetical protein